ncbi:glycosyltransferase [Kiritimatiellaeota bacterium B1221]|nr:glycosyltransferase [Kiritimatiellaeota bacterium B1221]
MKITIITPHFKSESFLAGCLKSVAVQASDLHKLGVSLHHHVQDGNSGEKVIKLLESHREETAHLPSYQFSYTSEKDQGMYDALNRAFSVTSGQLIGHLNSDEQYQPGALAKVWTWFENNPGIEVLFGAVVVTRGDGSYLCSRPPLIPQQLHTRICHLCTFTAAMFFRRSAIEKLDCYFNTRFQCAGDADLILRMLAAKTNMGTTPDTLSLFIDHGQNLALSPQAAVEQKQLAAVYGSKAALLRPLISMVHRLRKFMHGAYRSENQIYKFTSPVGVVKEFSVRTTSVWKR